ncbi:BTAD domain-containing putative transcriptional regulator [Mycobacterium sp.]|uniref:BTAD domain-containing putative transcriptional regulator n=1 Tax=Mycobacterium sp. TaxID=1785 RepID=UPI002608A836|nr:BTAD domain-containing putative transcriptional regulator [Mycobacterium sp.]
MELGVLGPVQVRRDGVPVTIPGAKPRAILTMLGLHGGSVVSADTLVELLWGHDPPRTAGKALQTHISLLRRILGDGFVLTEGAGWTLAGTGVDVSRYKAAARLGRDAAAGGDTGQAVARFEEALALWRGIPELPDGRRGTSEKTRWMEGHAALVEDRADALLATGRAAEIIGELEAAVADAPLRERRWGQLMLALYRTGRQGEALGAYQRARALLADELGVDPGPELRRLETAIVAQDAALETPAAQQPPAMTRAVTFLLTDIEGSTAAWEAEADAMAVALARHDELVEQVVTSRGGRLIKTRGEGDATFSVFERPSAAAAAAIELQEGIVGEPWALREPMRIRVALHTGEAELRDGDYFGRAVNRAARLRSLAVGGQILCSGAVAELVIDALPDDVALADLGMRELRNLARPEHVFELRLQTAGETVSIDVPVERPGLPAVLAGPGPFVGRGRELEWLFSAWQTALAGGTNAVLIAGEPGVGKTRLAGEWSRQAYEQGALVIYGRCDEDLGAPYQPFAEALRSLVPCLGSRGLRGLRGVEALLALVPGLTDVLPDLAAPTRADPDTERYALFDAVVALLGLASASVPVVLILDDLHWAAKPTLLLLRHLLRFGEQAHVQIVGTYRSTDLDRSHPLAAMLADLHRSAGSGSANRLQLGGLDEDDVTAYVAEAGYDDEELARALASVTGGNPFFLIEALRHVEESGGHWDPSTLPQGVREAVSRRLSRLPAETNKALAAAAVVGSRFALELVERVVGDDLVDAFDEASKAGIVIEEPGGRYRFNHAIVRQSLLAELPSVRRMRLHQRIATTLENESGADDERLAELAHHYFECAWAGNAAKAVEYCRRAADQAMARLAYEGAADLYDRALHALEEIDEELPDRDDQAAELLIARCEASLAAGDVASAAGAVSQLQTATVDSARLAAWATCFDGQLSMLIHPERLDEVEAAVGAAADKLAELDDAAGEAKAHTVRAGCLARLGRIGDCEIALDDALTAARRAREHRRVNAVLAQAPLAALWGPNPVPRAGGRCLDVVRLLRITTDSPAVEATSTRCQAVLEAFRGRAAAARRMIDSARRTVTELGLRHALLEVEQFAGIVELVVDDPGAAEAHLRQAYNGFRRMGLDADTAETAALLGRACLLLDRDVEADELCSESERLAGHALKPSIAWRTLRAQLLSRGNEHGEARRVAEAAVSLAERTDALVDHGDACLALATVLGTAGDVAGARAAAERAVGLWERKGAAALVEKARLVLGGRDLATAPAAPETPTVELDSACVRAGERVMSAMSRGAWDEFERLFAPEASIESRRKIIGFTLPSDAVRRETRRDLETGAMRVNHVMIAARGERVALSRLMVGTADATPGAPQDELLQLYGIDEEGRIALQVWFDVEDLDAALAELDAAYARFEGEHPPALRLENAASRVHERWSTYFAARDWDAITEMLADDISGEDRRRVVNSGLRQGRDAAIAEISALVTIGVKNVTSDVIATRGEHLVLSRVRTWGRDQRPEAFHTDALDIIEIDVDERVVARVVFDLDDFDAAIAELDERYLADEAAAHSRAWSVITTACGALSRGELFPTTPDWVNVDHRRGIAFTPGDLTAYIRTAWNLLSDGGVYIETARRLSNLGAVVTWVGHGTSQEGSDVEFRGINMLTVEGDLINRCELFDEADLDAAVTRFDQLSRPAPRLENTATRIFERLYSYVAAGDWHAVAQITADNVSVHDYRRVVNAGVLHGRDANIKDAQATADVGFTMTMVGAIATRGERLALLRVRVSGRDPEAIQNDALNIVEIDAEERIVGDVVFDLEDFDSAIAELDARYIAGEAAAYSRTWSVVAGALVAHNRREVAAATPDAASIDHRRVASFAPGEGIEYIRAGWDLDQKLDIYIETVHRVSDLGAVFAWAGNGTSHEGFAAEWRGINLLTVDGEMVSRAEVFDEQDVDSAVARFDQLSRPARRLQNAASRVAERFLERFAARDWDAIAEIFADDFSSEDRRRVVGAGIRHGRDVEIASIRAGYDLGGTNMTSTVIATRGTRLILTRTRHSGPDHSPEGFLVDTLGVVEINADNRIAARVVFEPDDIDTAFAELDARYLAGEAAAYSRSWSAVARSYVAANKQELRLTPDCETIDHRRARAFAPGELTAYMHATWDLAPNVRAQVEIVHRLNNLGAVVTHVVHGTSQEGFDAEWREVILLTVEGDLINRSEMFDEPDLDAAIASFEQLSAPAPRLENAASQVTERFLACFAAREWDTLPEILADNFGYEDRRRVVGAGVRDGRNTYIADMRASADLWAANVPTVMAIRGERLALARLRFSGRDQGPEAFVTDVLGIAEINTEERIVAVVSFDPDDFEAAIAELDARYLAGEAAAHAHTWSVIAAAYTALNRHQFPATTPDWVNIDHRGETAFGPGDLSAYLRAGLDLDQGITIYIESVHRLTDLGAVIIYAAHETSREGFQAEWRGVALLMVDGEMVNRCEVFEETDVTAAIARFEQLRRPAPRLENAASQAYARFRTYFAARDWAAMAELLTADTSVDDHRRVVNAEIRRGRDVEIANMQAFADIGAKTSAATVIATRGERLVLCRTCISREDHQAGGFRIEMLIIVETSADKRILARVAYDPDDIDAAFAELDARYLAGEAAAHARTWSVVTQAYAALNRRELPPTTPDWVNIDHRRGTSFASGEMPALLDAAWDFTTDLSNSIEAVHRLNDLGAVVTNASHETSQEGFDAEWRVITVVTVEGDMLNRCEVFDEADLDAAIAMFDQLSRPTPRLENPASQAGVRLLEHLVAGDWDTIAEIVADDFSQNDRRRVVGAGFRDGQDAEIEDLRAIADLGLTNVTSTIVATRGERLALMRVRFSFRDQGPEAFLGELLGICAINAEERIVGAFSFDLDDMDAAFEELDVRYLAGEAAAHAQTWSVIAAGYAAMNRHEVPPSAPDYVNIDHRLRATFEASDLAKNLRTAWDLTPDLYGYIEAVHRLSDSGAVVTHAAHGTSERGFDAEWRGIHFLTLDGDVVNRCEIFDEADLDAAIARFEELHKKAARLENTASQVAERFPMHMNARDWDAMTGLLAVDALVDDRRRGVNGGIRYGREAVIDNMRAAVDVRFQNTTSTAVATRGTRLALMLIHASTRAQQPGTFQLDVLHVVEINADGRTAAAVVFDLQDIDAAYEELDARYLTGEAAPYANTWTLVAGLYGGLNRHELPQTTPDFVNIDHRRLAAFAPGDMIEFARTAFDQLPDISFRIEAVHRLSNLGAVVSQALRGTSREGFEAEWHEIHLTMVEGDRFSHSEIFDETDLEAALARFEELHPPTRRLENAASRMYDRFNAYLAARDWDAMAEMVADDICSDDRRRVVSGGIQRGRDAQAANLRAVVDVGVKNFESFVIATRGERLVLTRTHVSGGDERSEAFGLELLSIIEIDTNNRIAAGILFDLNDIDAAFAELDARYLAGEAAAHSQTWSEITEGYAALNRHELPKTTSKWVTIDHRVRETFEGGDLTAYIRSAWNLLPDIKIYIETVHRLSSLGTVVTHAAYGTSQEGFEAEWRMVELLTFGDDTINHCELFDEADIDAALERFDELHQQTRQLENAASRASDRLLAYYIARDWGAAAEALADNFCSDDRRHVVNAGLRRGRDIAIANLKKSADLQMIFGRQDVIATRGERLVLSRARWSGPDQRPEAFHTEVLSVVEVDADERVASRVMFDANDIHAAFAELDARYLAGDAAAHTHTWSVITSSYAAFNQHQLATPDWVVVDHRPGALFASSNMTASVHAFWDQTPDLSIRIEAVHRLSDFGAVVTHAAAGTSPEGFAAEWRMIQVLTIEGDQVDRCELFDEADLDAALARFEELRPQAPRLENAASQLIERFQADFAARNWAAIAENSAEEIFTDDRRSVVGSGLLGGRDIDIANMRTAADLGSANFTSTVIATRGDRLVLIRLRMSGRDQRPEAFHSDMLGIVEIDADNRVTARILFDLDDIDSAFAELEARYLAGEAGAHARTWSVIARAPAGFNRHELPAMTRDPVYIDHRPVVAIEGADLAATLRAVWDITPTFSVHFEAVHRLDELGAVATQVLNGTTQEGFDAEWRMVELFSVEGGLISRVEVFEEANLDTALARFEELHPPARRLENAASRVAARFWTCLATRDWAAMAETMAGDFSSHDHRRVVNAGVLRGRDVNMANMRAVTEVGFEGLTSTVIATRGQRLALTRIRSSVHGFEAGEISADMLGVLEIDADNRFTANAIFDADDIDAAFEELDARYLAGEAAAHAHTWSVIAGAYAGLNQHESPPTTPDSVFIDHRPVVRIEAVDLAAALRGLRSLAPDVSGYVEAVHRLSEFGAVVTQVLTGTSQEGFDAEWPTIGIFTVDGGLISRCEAFDEADLDAALARFDELNRPAPRLENSATRVYDRLQAYFAAREWDAMAEILADDSCSDDRRRVVNAGIRRGRDVQIANMQTAVGLGTTNITSTVIANRGERLALSRVLFSGRDQRPEEFHTETLGIVEIDAEERIAALVTFDLDDVDAAFEELDARYLTGEAADYSHTWSVIAEECAAFNRHELTTVDYITVDHRPLPIVEAYSQAALRVWDVTPDFGIHAEAVHRLSGFGAVATYQANGNSPEGFGAEWRIILLLTVERDRINCCEVFDESDLDAALARFEDLQPPPPRLENAAGRIVERYQACFSARDWAAMAELLADDIVADDRRRVVNAGVRRGRDVQITDMRAAAEVGAETISSRVIATRGERLALAHVRTFNRGMAGDVGAEMLGVAEIDADERIVATVSFELDEIDAAFEELDARYLAGEAAAHAHTWSLNAALYAAFNKHELPATTPDWTYVDHRPLVTIDDLPASLPAIWEQLPDIRIYMEAVHRLSDLGAVVTAAAYGSSQERFDAERRMIDFFTVEGDLINRCEIFDETDVNAALARFDELDQPAPSVQNAATRAWARLTDAFNRRDLDGVLAVSSADAGYEDRRKGLGDLVGGPAKPKAVLAVFEMAPSSWRMEAEPIAIRGARLALARGCYRDVDAADRPIAIEFLNVMELGDDGLTHYTVSFDPDDIDAAFAELDARYLAGEAAAHAHTWSVVSGIYAGVNRHELPAMTPDFSFIDHRPLVTIEAGDLPASIRAVWDLTPEIRIYIETVHRLSDLGAVVTHTARGISHEDFDAEWRMIDIFTVDGDLISRCEMFDEADLDAALARFDELNRAPRLENSATRTWSRMADASNRRDMDGFLALTNADLRYEGRRKGLRDEFHGPARQKAVQAMFETVPISVQVTVDPIAIRGSRLTLIHVCYRDTDYADRPITVEFLQVAEVDDAGLMLDCVSFDPDDINDAFTELTARWIASGEVAHPEIVEFAQRVTEIINRHDREALAMLTKGATHVNHRQLASPGVQTVAEHMSSGQMIESLVPDYWIEPAEVVALSAKGLVVHFVLKGTSTDGVTIEIPLIQFALFEDGRVTHVEAFDPAQRDLALARFEELNRPG